MLWAGPSHFELDVRGRGSGELGKDLVSDGLGRLPNCKGSGEIGTSVLLVRHQNPRNAATLANPLGRAYRLSACNVDNWLWGAPDGRL